MRSIRPKDKSIDPDDLGFKADLSEIDKKKIRKMYKCEPYNDYKVSCTWVKLLFIDEVKTSIFARSDDNCGLNEYCALFVGECRTSLPDGSICLLDKVADHIITNIMVNTMKKGEAPSNATSLSLSLLCLLCSHPPPTMFHNLKSSLKL